MTNAGLVLAKLTTMREHTDRMERRRSSSLELFGKDSDRQDALALSLLVALQEAADIALHIASDEGWGVASSYAESFGLLAAHGVIDDDLARAWVGSAPSGTASRTGTQAWTSRGCGGKRRLV